MKNILASDRPYLIGITGSFGTGKSLVGEILKETGITVIDTDEIVRNILKTKNDVTQKIQDEFGNIVINNNISKFILNLLSNIIFCF